MNTSTLLQVITGPIAIILNILLVVALVVRELLRNNPAAGAQRARRLLGIACLPLLALFVVTVVVRLGSLSSQAASAQAPTAGAVAAAPSPGASSAPTSSPPPVPPTATSAAAPTQAPPVAATPTGIPTTTPTTAAATPAPSPTDVPAPSPTPAPSGTTVVAEQLPVTLADWPTRESATAQLRYADNTYQLVLSGQQNVGITSELPAANYRAAIEVALSEGEAGVVFLAVEPNTFYRVMMNTDQEFVIQEVRSDGSVRNVGDWTASTALQATTQLGIERQDNRVQFVANGQPLTTFMVPNGAATNQIGVALASATGQGQATFRNLVVEQATTR